MTSEAILHERGRQIALKDGQIKKERDDLYLVRSQSVSWEIYVVMKKNDKWTCTCPYYLEKYHPCKHIYAVEMVRRERDIDKEFPTEITIPDTGLACKFCGSDDIIRKGVVSRRKGPTQQYKCRECHRRFTDNLGFEYKQATPDQIAMAVELVYGGLSGRKAEALLRGMGVKVSRPTIMAWADQYAHVMEAYMDDVMCPLVGESWRTDELHIKVRGEKKYLFAMLDSDTRYWIARMVAEHKGTDDVVPLFRRARKVAGKVPEMLISDGAWNFEQAWKAEYRGKNFTEKRTFHMNEVMFDGKHHNNQMESFNGNTLRHREKVVRGLKKDDSGIISGLRIYHNFVRPHLGLDGKTPGEVAGIKVEGKNKIMTMIRAAASVKNTQH